MNFTIIAEKPNESLTTDLKQPEGWGNWFKELFYIILIAMCIRIFVFEPYHVPTGSMKNNIVEGDYVFGTKYDYGFSKYSIPLITPTFFEGRIFAQEPQRGDIIIFKCPTIQDKRFVKRLIGLPGDIIEFKDDLLYINSKPLKKELIKEFENYDGQIVKKYKETNPEGLEYEILNLSDQSKIKHYKDRMPKRFVVPEGHFFFMGDNRDESGDSRTLLGYIPMENLIAKAKFIYFSASESLFLPFDQIVSLDQIKQVQKWVMSINPKRMFKKL